eukprot:5562457-Prymnesium_polylepis.1
MTKTACTAYESYRLRTALQVLQQTVSQRHDLHNRACMRPRAAWEAVSCAACRCAHTHARIPPQAAHEEGARGSHPGALQQSERASAVRHVRRVRPPRPKPRGIADPNLSPFVRTSRRENGLARSVRPLTARRCPAPTHAAAPFLPSAASPRRPPVAAFAAHALLSSSPSSAWASSS